jgi:hypothetical protein
MPAITQSTAGLEGPKGMNFRPVPHPPFSPDLAPSDFELFEAIKRKMAALEFGRTEELVDEVTDITSWISHIALANVVREWE